MNAANATFASLLALGEAEPQANGELRKLARHALIPLAVMGGLLGVWTLTAPLSGAIVAAAKLKVELNRKTVQHQEGGIVRQILVRDGELVRAGQPLVVVGDVRNEAELSLLLDQLAAERIRNARASAEATLAPEMQAPSDLEDTPRALEHLARERALFAARRRTLDEKITALKAQIGATQAQGAALARQIESTEAAAKLASEELELNTKLARDGYVQRARLLQLQREEADYHSRLSESQSELELGPPAHRRAAGAHRAGAQRVPAAGD